MIETNKVRAYIMDQKTCHAKKGSKLYFDAALISESDVKTMLIAEKFEDVYLLVKILEKQMQNFYATQLFIRKIVEGEYVRK